MRSYIPVETNYQMNCPFSIALLADFHNSDPEPVLNSLQKRKPEIITVAGDFIAGDLPEGVGLKIDENQNALTLLKGCAEIAPTFVSPGNHEYMLSNGDLEAVKTTGITWLDNRWVSSSNIWIGGLSSAYFTAYRAYRDQLSGKELYPYPPYQMLRTRQIPELAWLDEFEKLEGFKILLCHHPDYYPRYLQDRKINLIFSGHCHGGQWRYYSLIHKEMRGIFAPGQGFFPPLTSGVHNNKLVISRGLSNPTFIPRINNPVEIVYIEPEKKESRS